MIYREQRSRQLVGFVTVIIFCYSFAFVTPVSAQANVPENRTALQGEVDLARLVDLCAQRLGLNIDYDASVLKGKVSLRLGASEGLSDPELWNLTNRVLALRGFTTVRFAAASPGAPESLSVVRLSDAAGLALVHDLSLSGNGVSPTKQEGTHPANGKEEELAGFETVVTRVEHQQPKNVADAIKVILSRQGSNVSTLGDSNLLLISDVRSRVDQALALLKEIDLPPEQSVVERIVLHHLPASRLVASATAIATTRDLVEGQTRKGKLLPAPGEEAVILISPKSEQSDWDTLVKSLDQEPPVETHTYTARYFGLDEVASLINQIVGSNSKSGAIGETGGGRGGQAWKIVEDNLTGSLVITASAMQHEQIKSIIDRLNALPPESRRPLKTFTIRNRPVSEVMSVLQGLIGSNSLANTEIGGGTSTSDSSSSSPSVGQQNATENGLRDSDISTTGSQQPSSSISSTNNNPSGTGSKRGFGYYGTSTQSGDQVNNSNSSNGGLRSSSSGNANSDAQQPLSPITLTADEGTNTIIAVGEPRLLDQVEKLISVLDVRQPQVMIEVMIVSLTNTQSLNLGVELRKMDLAGSVQIALSSLFGLSTVDANNDPTVGNAAGGTALVLSPGDFSVVVRALQTINEGRTLNMPKMLVNNNQQAVLNSVVQQPYTSVNASNTIATTSFGGSSDAGTVVTVKPQIAEGDHMIIQYSVTLSSFLGAATDPSLPPPRQENKLQSVATIPDGYVVALGGIEVQSQNKGRTQVPLLANIPVLGELFKNRANSQDESKFYIFIRPSILRRLDFEDLKYLSEKPKQETGIDDGWPNVAPQVIR